MDDLAYIIKPLGFLKRECPMLHLGIAEVSRPTGRTGPTIRGMIRRGELMPTRLGKRIYITDKELYRLCLRLGLRTNILILK